MRSRASVSTRKHRPNVDMIDLNELKRKIERKKSTRNVGKACCSHSAWYENCLWIMENAKNEEAFTRIEDKHDGKRDGKHANSDWIEMKKKHP